MVRAWQSLSPRYEAYSLIVPGTPSFVCQAELCSAHCCKAFSVSLGEDEVSVLAERSRLQPLHFLELEDGEPITLPLAKPYLLARRGGQCALLGPDLRCTQYHGRPDACRLYPHFVVGFDVANEKPVYGDVAGMRAAIDSVAHDRPLGGLVPLLLGHVECPGFTGPPLAEAAFLALLAHTAELQYPAGLIALEEGTWPLP